MGSDGVYFTVSMIVNKLSSSGIYTKSQARRWIYQDQPVLENKAPIDLIRKGNTKKVMNVVDWIINPTYL